MNPGDESALVHKQGTYSQSLRYGPNNLDTNPHFNRTVCGRPIGKVRKATRWKNVTCEKCRKLAKGAARGE